MATPHDVSLSQTRSDKSLKQIPIAVNLGGNSPVMI